MVPDSPIPGLRIDLAAYLLDCENMDPTEEVVDAKIMRSIVVRAEWPIEIRTSYFRDNC